jgi:hypothetical protein
LDFAGKFPALGAEFIAHALNMIRILAAIHYMVFHLFMIILLFVG